MSASPINRSSDILFLRCDLIVRKPENERSVLAELTWSVHPIINKTRMFGYLSSSPCFAHIRFPGSGKFSVRYFQTFCHYFNSKRSADSVGKSCCQTCSFSAKLRRLSCFTKADELMQGKEFGSSLAVFTKILNSFLPTNDLYYGNINTIMRFRV